MYRKLTYVVSFIVVLGLLSGASAELVGQWKLDEGAGTTALDATGNGNNGTLEDGPTVAEGQFGQALAFEDSRVAIPASDSLTADLFQGSFTLSAWINPKRTGDTWQQIFRSMREDDTSNDTLFINNDGRLSWRGRVNAAWAGGMCETASGVVPADQWTHVAVTGDGTNFRVYVNGALSQESAFQTTDGSNATYYIGGDPTWIGESYSGMIDDFRIYNHVMSEDDIKASMENQGGAIVKAYGPDPRNGTLHEDTWINLSWRAGDLAVSHDVYLGDNFDDVDAGAEGTFIGNQAGTFIVVGFPGFPYPNGLVPGTTYYWRIDEVNDTEPNSPWKGDIWSFNIPPKTAYFPDPADEAESVALDVELSWTAGFGTKLHTVYFGDNFDDVNSATGGLPQGATTYDPGTLKLAQTYYWRVDEFDAIETYKGHVWSFTTQGAVGDPNPANGAVDVKQMQIITWSPSVFAASHELYFGTDKDAVKNADTGSPEYKGTRDLGSESYDPGMLLWDTTYYWRVDEVNNTNPDSPWPGILWSFTTANFLIVDDFESYN
ncbi:MAG: LamG domain-containing protein, partial [Phycisphaerae bacterium]